MTAAIANRKVNLRGDLQIALLLQNTLSTVNLCKTSLWLSNQMVASVCGRKFAIPVKRFREKFSIFVFESSRLEQLRVSFDQSVVMTDSKEVYLSVEEEVWMSELLRQANLLLRSSRHSPIKDRWRCSSRLLCSNFYFVARLLLLFYCIIHRVT